jgi:addiction module HigA family antidote
MKSPVHAGELIRANLEALDLSVAEAAKGLHVTRQQLHNVFGGRSAVSPEMAARFEKAFGGSAGMWLRMLAAFDLAQLRAREGEISVAGSARPGDSAPPKEKL